MVRALSSFTKGSEMDRMASEFLSAPIPTANDLAGAWVETRSVATQQFMTGRRGPDAVSFDSAGLRDAEPPDRPARVGEMPTAPFRWALSVSRSGASAVTVSELRGGSGGRPTQSNLSAAGFSFDPDFGADERITYTCRMSDARTLVCLDLEHIGSGSKFRKVTPEVSRAFLPAYTSASRDLNRIGAALEQRSVCYHSVYPLTHTTQSPYALDTWLALTGSPDAPVGDRMSAAIVEDSIGHLAEWWRSTARAHVPDSRPDGWRPGALDFVVTTADHDIRGRLAVNDSEFTGIVYDITDARSWGVDGVRMPCPAFSGVR